MAPSPLTGRYPDGWPHNRWQPQWKRWLAIAVGLVIAAVLGLGTFVFIQCLRFDASMKKVYDVPLPNVVASKDPAVIARGNHLVHSIALCAASTCHGPDLGGSNAVDLGPVGSFAGPNLTLLALAYSDGELARLVRDGIKKDGRSVRVMTCWDFSWLPEADVGAIVSYVRLVPRVDRPNGTTVIKLLGKVLDRLGKLPLDVARHLDHSHSERVPPPQATAAYGAFLARGCAGCHGNAHLAGGRIPGTPASVPTPLNLTPDETGLKGWTFEDLEKALRLGIRKNGRKLDPFMPVECWRNYDDTEMHALWSFLQTLPPMPLGQR